MFERKHEGMKPRNYFSAYRAKENTADPLNREWIYENKSLIFDQLCRNAIFAHWLADGREMPVLVNLVRKNDEINIEDHMKMHLCSDTVVFRRCVWEELYSLPEVALDNLGFLKRYMEIKTCRLQRAFSLY
jgi:hypothetical protein